MGEKNANAFQVGSSLFICLDPIRPIGRIQEWSCTTVVAFVDVDALFEEVRDHLRLSPERSFVQQVSAVIVLFRQTRSMLNQSIAGLNVSSADRVIQRGFPKASFLINVRTFFEQ